jgi:hypothetical protein
MHAHTDTPLYTYIYICAHTTGSVTYYQNTLNKSRLYPGLAIPKKNISRSTDVGCSGGSSTCSALILGPAYYDGEMNP